MNIDIAIIRRLRDALLEGGRSVPENRNIHPIEDNAGHRQATLDRFTPFAETMYIVAMIDGEADATEFDALRGAMRILTSNQLSDDALTAIFKRCRHNVSEYGMDSYLELIGRRLSADQLDRETAFTLAAAVALADNRVHTTESTLMQSIAQWYGISDRTAQRLLQEI